MNEMNGPAGPIKSTEELVAQMTTPSQSVRDAVSAIGRKVMILGVGGKMGPSLAELIVKAGGAVIGVDVFPDAGVKSYLDKVGVTTIQMDLFDSAELARLPEMEHVIIMAGTKFGSSENTQFTWAMNSYLPGKIMENFTRSKVIYISSGNVYKFTSVESNGATEISDVEPIGEYAMSRLGGERIVEYQARRHAIPSCIIRLFYATELRYGVIHDIAVKVKNGETLDVSMGHFNQIWQGDANAYIVKAFSLCQTPAKVINLTGPDVLSVRDIATRLGQLMGMTPKFRGTESPTALLGDASEMAATFGKPAISPDQIMEWVAWWVQHDGESLGKPTKFEKRNGKF
ncbi:MAG: NAD-dependent epimerase/dehydratase family protein [Candidatus Zhuqueibacterota bacterium]